MKNLKSILLAGFFAAGLQMSQASLITYDSSLISVGTQIPDNNLTGISSTFTVSGSGIGFLENVRINVNISGGFDGDLYAYITHDGQHAILLNRIGTTGTGTFGSSQAGMSIWFDDSVAAPNVHTAGTLSPGGVYGSDGRDESPTDLAAINAASAQSILSDFYGQSAEGDWTLFLADASGGGVATLDSWALEITGIPEPANVALAVFGGAFVVLQGVRFWKRKQACKPA